jgi:predicted transcriptional regulator
VADEQNDILTLTAEITASYLGNASHVKAEDIPGLIRSIRQALSESDQPAAAEAPAGPAPKMHAATVKKSITPDALISFIDNKPYKTLKRHLSRHGHDMKSYREAFGLPSDYPAVAPNYSAARSEMARKLGLGARGRGASAGDAAQSEPEVAAVADGDTGAKRPRARKAS